MFVSLGKKTVTTAGTPVQISSTSIKAHSVCIQVNSANTGKIYIGTSTLVAATYVGVLKVLPPPSASSYPEFVATQIMAQNGIDLSELWIDSSVNGESAIVSYMTY
jgi:hypothetical protein